MCGLWQQVADDLEHQRIPYCVLRDGEEPIHGERRVELDLLVDPAHCCRLERLLAGLGFARLPRWGYAPHEFFVAYDKKADCWLKLDVVTRVAYGKEIHAIDTPLAENCLAHRLRVGRISIPSAEDELFAMLLHCIIDKGHFSAVRRKRILLLCEQVTDDAYLNGLLQQYWPARPNWQELRVDVAAGKWDELLAEGPSLIRHLSRGQRTRVVARRMRDRLCRKAGRVARMFRPESPTVALLAPDGAGKSSVAQALANTFFTPVQLIYMGLYGEHDPCRGKRVVIPGWGLARRILVQWSRYVFGRYHQARGKLVLFDRYTYDAMMPTHGRLTRLRQIRRWLLSHCCPHPDLVLVLDAPGEILFARKGEHTSDQLERQRQAYRQLHGRLAKSVLVDATQDFDGVRREVTSFIWGRFAERCGRGTSI